MDIDIDSYAALAVGDEDIHVELDEKDFSDPHLLNELSALTGNQDSVSSHVDFLADTPSNKQEQEAQAAEQTPEIEQQEDNDGDPQIWKEKATTYQKMALEAKKNGDKKRAVQLLRESKACNQKYTELLEIYQETTSSDPPMDASSTANQNNALSITDKERSLSQNPSLQEPPQQQQQQVDPSALQDLLTKVISLQKEYKNAALHYKKINNLIVAKEMVRISKDLLHTGVNLKNGQITDIKSIQLPGPPDMSLGDSKMRQLNEVNVGKSPASFEQIEAELSYQINVCHNLSVQNSDRQSKASNSKTAIVAQPDAYYQAEKALSADLVSLRAYKNGNSSLPPLHYEQTSYVYKNINDHIPSNMMELKVIRAVSLPTLDIATNLEPFVTWDLGGWPPENTAQASMNKGETSIQKGPDPQFDFSLMIPITRTNRAFLRYLQRKKLTVEVFHNKYSYGLFRRPTSLGKVVIPMERLVTKSSISGTFDLLDSSRKKTGGKIEIQVNLREPLTGEDTVKRSERWLILDAFGSTASAALSAAGLTVGGPQTSTTMASPIMDKQSPAESRIETPKEEAKQVAPEPKAKQATPEQNLKEERGNVTVANDEFEQAEEEFNSVDSIVSNMVLEHEMSLVNAALASPQSKNKDDLMDRKQALEIKMNMLVIQVQTGILDMETYLNDVEKRIEQDRRLALVFKKHNRLDLAKSALTRKKIMQDELNEARAALAENDA
ncbi:uncharacterized protein RHIMIDRAFT_273911 [Rhizopus microsporus ATCC 52813]|uniref:C2 domain-containing protein n=2 Tax=Rhizopus microsporus TaxID=58291 RepID=A0A2G4SFX7_RHIZD|nr:uncharacterized protein RHIMIDRAFT_273911 [Rhizopus microsporus ATCC 52813]PHZ07675.1 hypothetical protein RHIMIDRAFT_273911 [Rhizopus microsporus ATCC 52813]